MKTAAHHDKPLVGLLCVVIAFAFFYIIYQNQSNIAATNSMSMVMILATLAMGMLIGVFYLVSNRIDKHVARSSKKKRK